MSVRLEDGVIRLEGDCRVEDAESLVLLLQRHPGAQVDVSLCRLAHSAILQALLAFGPQVMGKTGLAFLDELVFAPLGPATRSDSDAVVLPPAKSL